MKRWLALLLMQLLFLTTMAQERTETASQAILDTEFGPVVLQEQPSKKTQVVLVEIPDSLEKVFINFYNANSLHPKYKSNPTAYDTTGLAAYLKIYSFETPASASFHYFLERQMPIPPKILSNYLQNEAFFRSYRIEEGNQENMDLHYRLNWALVPGEKNHIMLFGEVYSPKKGDYEPIAFQQSKHHPHRKLWDKLIAIASVYPNGKVSYGKMPWASK